MMIKKNPSWRTKSLVLRCNIRRPMLTPLHLRSVQLLHTHPSYPKPCCPPTKERPNLRIRWSGKLLQIRRLINGFRSQKTPWGLMADIHPALLLLHLVNLREWTSRFWCYRRWTFTLQSSGQLITGSLVTAGERRMQLAFFCFLILYPTLPISLLFCSLIAQVLCNTGFHFAL